MSRSRGRPTLHGLKVITGERIRKTRIALASGSSRKRVAEEIFKVSPRTFRRYLSTDEPIAKALKRAVEDGELLKNEPLATLICMLIDKRDALMIESQSLLHREVRPDGLVFSTSEGISDEDEKAFWQMRDQVDELKSRIEKAVKDNDEIKRYLSRDGRKNNDKYETIKDNHEFIYLNEIAIESGVKPFQTNDYLYKSI